MHILSISTQDIGGGAERFANDLNQCIRETGFVVDEFVGYKRSDLSDHRLVSSSSFWETTTSIFDKIERWIPSTILNLKGLKRLLYYLRTVSRGPNAINYELGRQGFYFPSSWQLIDQCSKKPDLILLHNLHGNYFDLRALTYFSKIVPIFWVLHDEWAYTGRCAHTQSCQGWKQGCGICPDLASYVSFPRDGSKYNLEVKTNIYQNSKFYIISPSAWIASRVTLSVLAPAVNEIRIFPYGIDQSIFFPGSQLAARNELKIESDCFVVTFIAVNARKNSWKDYATFESAALQLASKYPTRKILFQVLGDRHDPITCGKSRIEFIDGITDKSKICNYLRASDVYLHSARVDNYPLAILEALSCGLPVIASAVGGIPEQVLGYEKFQQVLSQSNRSHIETATGLLVDPMSSEQQVLALETLMSDQKLRSTLSHNAIIDSKKRFNLKKQSELYMEWFNEIIQSKGSAR